MSEHRSKVTISDHPHVHCQPELHPHQPHPHHQCPNHCEHQDFVLSEGIPIHLQKGKEVHKDIVLSPNPFKDCGTLSGIIKDKQGCPIENALVKVFDSEHHPVTHVFTNKEGQFLICLAPGQYILKAVR